MDIGALLGQENGVLLASRALDAQDSEGALLRRCSEAGLRRVIEHLESGVWFDPDEPASTTPVPYIVTEWADGGDMRRTLMTGGVMDTVFALGVLHGLAASLQQVHALGIAHLDLKPSNGLHVGSDVKLSDFGHAVSSNGQYGAVMGTAMYAPPELLFGSAPATFQECRAVDLYLLGSLIAGIFVRGLPMTAIALHRMPAPLHPQVFGGTLSDVLPFLVATYEEIFHILRDEIPDLVDRDRVCALVAQLCWPDPAVRGLFREQFRRHTDRLSLRSVISELDLIAKRAACRMVT